MAKNGTFYVMYVLPQKKDAKLTMTHFQMGANLEELNLGPLHVPLGGVTSLCFLDFE